MWELVHRYKMDKDNLPEDREVLTEEYAWGPYVGIYLTEEQFKERQGQLFPTDPVTGAFCIWDHDWTDTYDLL